MGIQRQSGMNWLQRTRSRFLPLTGEVAGHGLQNTIFVGSPSGPGKSIARHYPQQAAPSGIER